MDRVEFIAPFRKEKKHSKYFSLHNKHGQLLLCCDLDEEWVLDAIIEVLNKEQSDE